MFDVNGLEDGGATASKVGGKLEGVKGAAKGVLGAKVGVDANSWNPPDHPDGPHASDIPFEPGSVQAKLAFEKVWQAAHSPAMAAKGKAIHPDACGFYNGKPLVTGSAGTDARPEGDMDLLRDKLMYKQGYPLETAQKIGAAIKYRLHPNASGALPAGVKAVVK